MTERSVICPNCKKEFALNQTILGALEEELRKEYDSCMEEREEELKRKEVELDRSMKEFDENLKLKMEEEKNRLKETISREAEEKYGLEMKDLRAKLDEKECRVKELEQEELKLRRRERELQDREKDFDRQFKARIEEEKLNLKEILRKEAEEKLSMEISDLGETLKEKEKTISQFRQQELQMRKRQRELEDREQALTVEMERKLDKEKKEIESRVSERLQEQHHLKELEKEKTIKDLRDQIEIMKIKAEQGSQQLQGEVLELEMEEALVHSFPYDDISEVPKGIRGADIIQKVRTESGRLCGTILWETKRTKNWSDEWIVKLKDDQRELGADLSILCTKSLPRDVKNFDMVKGVVVTTFGLAIPIATILRNQLNEVSRAKRASEGISGKKELLYNYLIGPEFKQNVEGIVESFLDMKKELDKEKAALGRIWAKREKQMLRALTNLTSIYGSMQGIAGVTMPSIDSLEMDRIPERSTNGDDPSLDDY